MTGQEPADNQAGLAQLYAIDGSFVVQGHARWEEFGGWAPTMALQSLDDDVDDARLGEVVLGVLEAGAAMEANAGGEQEALFKAAGVRSQRQLVKAANLVVVRRRGGGVEVSPWPRDPTGAGWVSPSHEPTFRVDGTSTSAIGARIRRALSLLAAS